MIYYFIGGAIVSYIILLIELVKLIFCVSKGKYEDAQLYTVKYICSSVFFLLCILMCCKCWFS